VSFATRLTRPEIGRLHAGGPLRLPLAACVLVLASPSLLAAQPGLAWPEASPIKNEFAKLLSSSGAPGDQFGLFVALDGDTAIVGAPMDDDNGPGSGSAYVFVRSGGMWREQAKLLASDGQGLDRFGVSVAVTGDTVIVGADDGGGFGTGSAYVFVRSGGTWTEQAKLLASDGSPGDAFGFGVAASGDRALVGAWAAEDPDRPGFTYGAAYVFERSGTTWTEQAKLLASDGESSDLFGASVALSGETAVVGAAAVDNNRVQNVGAAYVFVGDGGTWTEEAKLLASDGTQGDNLGASVTVTGDTVVAGAPRDDEINIHAGSAYVFVRSGNAWTEEAKLLASDGSFSDLFGWSVAVSGDTVVAGAPGDDANGFRSGSAYVFVRQESTWTEKFKLLASDGAVRDAFGETVAVSGDAAVVGASGDDGDGPDSGSTYVFEQVATSRPDSGRVLAPISR
jgi:hypothetical protein